MQGISSVVASPRWAVKMGKAREMVESARKFIERTRGYTTGRHVIADEEIEVQYNVKASLAFSIIQA